MNSSMELGKSLRVYLDHSSHSVDWKIFDSYAGLKHVSVERSVMIVSMGEWGVHLTIKKASAIYLQ